MKLEVWDGSAYTVVADRVFFDVHEHFDPEFLWYSDYAPPGQAAPGVVPRPKNAANDVTEGWLLVAGDKLDAVKLDSSADPRAPKWPKTTG